MKKLISISLMFIFSVSIVRSQDIIYTISGQFDEENISLDSILIENITNGTEFLFDDLPENPDYQINLTEKQYWGTTGINSLKEDPGFVVLRNIPGKLSVRYTKNTPINVNVSVYNINGQKLYSSGKNTLQANNIIRLELESVGVFLVKLESPDFVQSFKSIGAGNLNSFNVKISDEGNSKEILKSASTIKDADFSFEVGDSLIISAFKNGYYAPPIGLKVADSQSIEFEFINNFLKINNEIYTISDGLYSYSGNFEGKGVFNHSLYLLAPEHNINWETYEINGTGPCITFEIFNTQKDLEDGEYTFSLPEIMNTEKLCDGTDTNADGVITDADCVYTMPDGKSYISSRLSGYGGNVDLNAKYNPFILFSSGVVTITGSENNYFKIKFDCIGENGDKIIGLLEGQFHYLDVSN